MVAKPISLLDMPEADALDFLMQFSSGDEGQARMLLAIARGEIPGDVVELGKKAQKQWGKAQYKHYQGQHDQSRHGWRFGRSSNPYSQFRLDQLGQIRKGTMAVINHPGASERDRELSKRELSMIDEALRQRLSAARRTMAKPGMRGERGQTERDEYRKRAEMANLDRAGQEIRRMAGLLPLSAWRPKPQVQPKGAARMPKVPKKGKGDTVDPVGLNEDVIARFNEFGHAEGAIRDWKASGLKGDPASFAMKAFSVRDPKSGLQTRINDIRYVSATQTLHIKGDILDKDGNFAGSLERSIQLQDKNVYHDLLSLEKKYQGSGFGSTVYQHMEKTYVKTGLKTISIFANLDVGGYAWARMGFDFSGPGSAVGITYAIARRWEQQYGKPMPRAMFQKLSTAPAWKLAAFVGPDGTKLGKEAMLGRSWHGIKLLDKNSPHWKVGRKYYNEKKKKQP